MATGRVTSYTVTSAVTHIMAQRQTYSLCKSLAMAKERVFFSPVPVDMAKVSEYTFQGTKILGS